MENRSAGSTIDPGRADRHYPETEEIDMHRFRHVGIVLALTFITLFGSIIAPHAVAQDSGATAHPIVGMWWWENASADPFDDSFAVFQEGGTYVEETPFIGAGIGTWVATGERTADLLIVFQDIEGGLEPNDPAAFVAGTWTFHLSIEVNAAGDELVANGPIEMRTPDGALVDAMDWTGTAKRISIGWEIPASPAEPEGSPTPG